MNTIYILNWCKIGAENASLCILSSSRDIKATSFYFVNSHKITEKRGRCDVLSPSVSQRSALHIYSAHLFIEIYVCGKFKVWISPDLQIFGLNTTTPVIICQRGTFKQTNSTSGPFVVSVHTWPRSWRTPFSPVRKELFRPVVKTSAWSQFWAGYLS